MQLIEALDPLYSLYEGVKFTTAQIQDVKKRAHQIYVSGEYEYYVNEEHAGDDEGGMSEEVRDMAMDRAQEEFNQNRDEWLNDAWNESNLEEIAETYYDINKSIHGFAAPLSEIYEIISNQYDFDEWEEMLDPNNDDYADNRKLARTAVIKLGALQGFNRGINSDFNDEYEELLPYTYPVDHGIFDGDELQNIANFIKLASHRADKIHNTNVLSDHDILSNLEFLCNNTEDIDNIDTYLNRVNELHANFQTFVSQIEDHFKESMEDIYEDHLRMHEHEWVIQRADELINSGAFDEHMSQGSGLEFSEDSLQDHSNPWHIDYHKEIEVIEPEARENQLELKTNPLPIDEAIKTMEKIFDFIGDVGYTDESCGLHINMSFKNERFVPENFDPIKLVMLMGTNETITRFPVRNYVDDILERVKDDEVLLHLAQCRKLKGGGGDDLLSEFSRMISKGHKFQTINFNHLYNRPQNTKRIEFRYPGGKNYEKRLNEFQVELYKQAYMLEAAFNPDFLHNEYLKRVVKVLDQAVKEKTIYLMDRTSRTNPVVVDKKELHNFVELQDFVDRYQKMIDQGHATDFDLD